MTLTNSTSLMARAHDGDVTDDTDPAARPTRRTFTAEQKLAILAGYDEATGPGEKGAYLRREGIYSSQSPNGGEPGRRAAWLAWKGPLGANAAGTSVKWTGSARRTSASRPSWKRRERPST
jgi:hypothetical protein